MLVPWYTMIFSIKCLKDIDQNQKKDSNTYDLFQQRYIKAVENIICRQLFNTKFEKLNWIKKTESMLIISFILSKFTFLRVVTSCFAEVG